MRREVLGLLVLLTSAGVGSGAAQAKPDFSGTWIFDEARSPKMQTSYAVRVYASGRRGAPQEIKVLFTPSLGSVFTAIQDARTLKVRRMTEPSASGVTISYTLAYALDGSENTNTIPSPTADQPATVTLSTATWTGQALVIDMWIKGAPPSEKQQRRFELQADGSLAVTHVVPAPDGAAPVKTTTIYTRKAGTPGTSSTLGTPTGTRYDRYGYIRYERDRHLNQTYPPYLVPDVPRTRLMYPAYRTYLTYPKESTPGVVSGTFNRLARPDLARPPGVP